MPARPCAYCTYAHLRAFQLYFFRDEGRLFPLDEEALLGLAHQPDDQVRASLEQALVQSGLGEDIGLLRRLYQLKFDGEAPNGPRDEVLVRAVHLYDALNACALSARLAPDDAHDPINKDRELRRRYEQARAGAGDPDAYSHLRAQA